MCLPSHASGAVSQLLVCLPIVSVIFLVRLSVERCADQGGWGWSDCRDVALCNGRTVTGDLATSVYGARVDYIWASPAMLRDWDVCEVSHVDVAQMHAPDAFTDHALVTCTLGRR